MSYPDDIPDVPTVNGKPWYKSKTLWFNGLALVVGVVEMQFKLLEQYIPAAVFPALAFVLAVSNVLLRFITTTALIVPKVDQPAPPAPPSPPMSQAGFINLAVWLPALKWLGAAAVLAWAVFCIYDAGRDVNEAKWIKKEAAQAKLDQGERDRIAAIGRIAAEYEIQEQIRAAERDAHLLGVMKNARKQFSLLAVPSRVLGAVHLRVDDHASAAGYAAGQAAAGGAGCASSKNHEDNTAAPNVNNQPVDSDHDLTLGAVWLWNSALTGQAAAAGACRVDAATGQADPACAQPSGLDLDAAFANHAANAQSCREDRARHQRLIDYLHSLQPSLSK